MHTSDSDWMTHPETFSIGTEWAAIGLLSAVGLYLFLVVGMKLRPVWAFVGVMLLPVTLVLLVLWSALPVWLTRTLLVAGAVDQALRRAPCSRRSCSHSHSPKFSRN